MERTVHAKNVKQIKTEVEEEEQDIPEERVKTSLKCVVRPEHVNNLLVNFIKIIYILFISKEI